MFGYEEELQDEIRELKAENEKLKLRLSDVSHSFDKDISNEIDFFSKQKEAMVDVAMMMFEDKLSSEDLIKLKKSFERVWVNGLRYGLSKNCD
jgi:ferredoxin-fold anticodon binding domain-containing protein